MPTTYIQVPTKKLASAMPSAELIEKMVAYPNLGEMLKRTNRAALAITTDVETYCGTQWLEWYPEREGWVLGWDLEDRFPYNAQLERLVFRAGYSPTRYEFVTRISWPRIAERDVAIDLAIHQRYDLLDELCAELGPMGCVAKEVFKHIAYTRRERPYRTEK